MNWAPALLGTWVLMTVPSFATAVYVARRRDTPVWALASWALVGFGMHSMITFWLTFWHPSAGHLWSFVVPIVSAAYLVRDWRRYPGASPLRPLLPCWAASLTFATFVVAYGFLFGGEDRPLVTAQQRFTYYQPGDNEIPYQFAQHVAKFGHIGTPMRHGVWLSSDRPPLESGSFLLQWPITHLLGNPALQYEVVGASAQAMSLVTVWAILVGFRLPPRARALTLAAMVTSFWAITNTFYTWPKLLAVVFLAPAVVLTLRAGRPQYRQHWALLGASCALALMSHGTAGFALVGLGVAACLLMGKRLVTVVRPLVASLAVLAVIGLPWIAYQKFFDPPGDHLLKYQFAGIENVDPRSFMTALADQYRAVGLSGALHNRLLSPNLLFWKPMRPAYHPAWSWGSLGMNVQGIRWEMWYSLLPAVSLLWLTLPWAIQELRDPRSTVAAPLKRLLFGLTAILVFWWLSIFAAHELILIVGTLLMPALITAILVIACYARSPRVAGVIVAVTAIANVALLFPRFDVTTFAADVTIQRPLLLGVAIVALGLCGCCLWLDARSPSVTAPPCPHIGDRAGTQSDSAQ